jgi:NADH-quinone oxidoreductase subunit C
MTHAPPQKLMDVKALVEDRLSATIACTEFAYGELTLWLKPASLIKVATFLRDHDTTLCQQLMDVCGVDYPGRQERFEVVYNLLSLKRNFRIRLKVPVAEGEAVPTLTGVFRSAGWWEREAYDMFGIPFKDHPDLRRILTDYEFEGFPLRKDFPLTGFVEVRYSEEKEAVIYEPVNLVQSFRRFDFTSPWEGMSQLLPGDEKAIPLPSDQKGAP